MIAILAVSLILSGPGSFEAMSRNVSGLMDGWVSGSPSSALAPEQGSMFRMALALIRADASLQAAFSAPGAGSSEYMDCLKAAAGCVDWFRSSLALFPDGSQEQWIILEEGLVQRLHLLQDRELEYLESLQG